MYVYEVSGQIVLVMSILAIGASKSRYTSKGWNIFEPRVLYGFKPTAGRELDTAD